MHLGLMKHLVCRDMGDVAQPEGLGTSRLPSPQQLQPPKTATVPGGSRAETRKQELGLRIALARGGGSGAEPEHFGVAVGGRHESPYFVTAPVPSSRPHQTRHTPAPHCDSPPLT